MSTLFQLHSNIKQLQSITCDMARLWQAGDSILLLGETVAYLEWLTTYIEDINTDDTVNDSIHDITAIYILTDDIHAFSAVDNQTIPDIANIATTMSAMSNTPIPIKPLSDVEWVQLTQRVDRVVTLRSTL